MITTMRNRALALLVTIHMVLFVTSPALAAVIPAMGASPFAICDSVKEDINTIQQALETKVVKEKLKDYGLSTDEIDSKLSLMTAGQIHLLATASQDVLLGGDANTVILVIGILMTAFALFTLLNFILGTSHSDSTK